MSEDLVLVEKTEHVTTLTINRPKAMNSINPHVTVAMDKAFNDYRDDPDQWVCILTGAGEKAFSAGNDLKFTAEHGLGAAREIAKDVTSGFGGITERDDTFKPVIAAVNGLAMGGGFELALACDIIIASDNAFFSFPEPRVGLMADAGGVHRLPRQIPYHLAMDMLLTSRRVTADEALGYGLVSKVVSLMDLLPTAQAIADEIMQGSPIALQATKQSIIKGLESPLQVALKAEKQSKVKELHQSEDLIEGPRAFSEKRKPVWKGA
jgi:crotonobetainyl-CoA hydratase